MAKFTKDGAAELYYDNSKKLETTSWGVQVSGTVKPTELNMDDNHKLQLGNSADLRLYHDGSNSYITDVGTGSLLIDGSAVTLRTGSFTVNNAANTENMLYAQQDGGVTLYHNSSNVFTTHSTGATVNGELYINNSDTKIEEGSGNAIKVTTPNGYIQVGSLNSSYAHFYTDLPQYFFSDSIEVNGNLKPYSTNTRTLGDNSHRWSTVHATNYEVYGSIQNVGIGKGVAILRDRIGHDVETGSFSSGADRIRELNVHETSGITGLESFVTLDTTNHYFTLPAGTYFVYFDALAFDVNNHRAKIITYNGTDVIFGTNARTAQADSTSTYSSGWGYISTASQQSYYLVHRCSTTRSTKGFGLPCDFASENEYHAQVTIFRIS